MELEDKYMPYCRAGLTVFGIGMSNVYGADKLPEHLVPNVIAAFAKMCGVHLLTARVPHLKSKPYVLFHPHKLATSNDRGHWRMVMRGIVAGLMMEINNPTLCDIDDNPPEWQDSACEEGKCRCSGRIDWTN